MGLKFSLFIKKIGFALIVVLPGFSFSQIDGLVAKYSFNDGTAKDEVGNNDGKTYNLKPIEDRFGNTGSAFFFLGNNDSYLNLGTDSVLKPKHGSISLWVNLDRAVYRGHGIACNGFIYTRAHKNADFNEAYQISYDFNLKKIGASNTNSDVEQTSLYPVNKTYLHFWYHVVLVYDKDHSALYINGVLEARASKNFETRFLDGDSVVVGVHNELRNNRSFAGVIDDIEIYNRVLSQSEVLKLYNAPNPNKKNIALRLALGGILLIILIFLLGWWIKWRIAKGVKIEKEKNVLNVRLIELETRAIRTQMNPHFIFNSLNTLQRFILEDDKAKSYTYLIEFSKLLRKLLESSESDTISLKDEIEILKAYLDIEKLRFDNSFEFKITSEVINTDEV
ncbi:MAG: histidine kinase, partial [Bacteroidia bacterium]